MTDAVFWLWIVNFFGCDKKRIWDIYHTFEHPKLMYEAIMAGTVPLTEKESFKIGSFSISDAERVISYCNSKNYSIVTYSDPGYPKCLNDIKNPPCMLFYMGDINLLDNDYNITVAGSRNSSHYSHGVTEKLCSGLVAQGFNIVSGFALGIDSVAHRTAIHCGGKTIAVLGCGLDVDYPAQNAPFKGIVAKRGVILSEYLPGTRPVQANFPKRNRILAAASPATLIIEASAKGGTLITADLANSLGRKIFCVPPSDIFDERYAGLSVILKRGGRPVYSVDDITCEYYRTYSAKLKSENNSVDMYGFSESCSGETFIQQSLFTDEKSENPVEKASPAADNSDDKNESQDILKLKEFLKEGSKNIDEIACFLDMNISEAMAFMLNLELCGKAASEAGGRYKLL